MTDPRIAKALARATKRVEREPPAPKEKPVEPTTEQHRKGVFVREGCESNRGVVAGTRYRREPRFETLAKEKGGGIDDDALRALRFYRSRYEDTVQSLTRCALDGQGRGGGGLPSTLPPVLLADEVVRECEAAVGNVLPTMRAVAIDDQSYSEIAIERFGGRKQNWLEQEKGRGRRKDGAKFKFVDKVVPKSGRHRELIKAEFLVGLERLTNAAAPYISTKERPRRGVWVSFMQAVGLAAMEAELAEEPADGVPAVDPRFLDEAGHMRPDAEIADILRSAR